MLVRKAVFPVAGLGTRFLPATKASPKEMLPIVDKPLIQYAVEEAIEAGVKELIFVTSNTKRAIEDHFDINSELEDKLRKAGKEEFLQVVRSIVPSDVTCVYIRQPETLGLGHAVLCARRLIGNEPFAVVLADDLIHSSNGNCLTSMMHLAEETGSSVVAVEQVPREDVTKYGIIEPTESAGKAYQIRKIVEKPELEDAPSRLAVVGRYILAPEILPILAATTPGAGGEIQLTDAIATLLDKQSVFAYEFEGKRYDCGDKMGYLSATVEYGLRHPELSTAFKKYLENLCC